MFSEAANPTRMLDKSYISNPRQIMKYHISTKFIDKFVVPFLYSCTNEKQELKSTKDI